MPTDTEKIAIGGAFLLLLSQAAQALPPPPPPPTQIKEIYEYDFTQNSLNGFRVASESIGNFVFSPDGLVMNPGGTGYQGIYHVYKRICDIHPGDTVIQELICKAGPPGDTTMWDRGIGLGFDIKLLNNPSIMLTRNAQATISTEWVKITDKITIPRRAFDRVNGYGEGSIQKISDNSLVPSFTSGVMNFGINDHSTGDVYKTQDLPQTMGLTSWLHIWGKSLLSGTHQKLKITVIRGAQ